MCSEPTEQKLSAVFMGVSSWGFGGTNVGGSRWRAFGLKGWGWLGCFCFFFWGGAAGVAFVFV